jgi:hypothetical protein
MSKKVPILLGIICLILPIFLLGQYGHCWVGVFFLGFVLIIICLHRIAKPKEVILLFLLAITNACHWISYVLWMLLVKYEIIALKTETQRGIDSPFVLESLWMLIFLLLTPYQLYQFVRGIINPPQRKYSLLGILLMLAQCLTIFMIYERLIGE